MTSSDTRRSVFPARPFKHRTSVGALLVGLLACCFSQIAFAQTAANPGQTQATNPSTDEARQIFVSVCAGCHGLDGRGGERGPDISTRPQIIQLSDAELLQILHGGRPAAGMPPFDSFGTTKLKELVAYLRVLQGKSPAAALPGDPRVGKVLFFGKARCSECHTIQGSGGFLGRDLSTYGATLSPLEIRSSILHPDPANKANKTAVIAMRNSQQFTGVIRNEDNFSMQLQSLDGAFHFLTRSDVTKIEFLPQPIMSGDYAAILKPAELDDLVNFIIAASKTGKNSLKDQDDE